MNRRDPHPPRTPARARLAAALLAAVAILPLALTAWRDTHAPALLERARALPTAHGIRWLTPDGAWSVDAPRSIPAHAVLLIHGLDEPGGIWDQLAPALAEHHHPTLRFDYPNDQAIARSADELAAQLQILRAQGVTSLDIIAHSMGGLIARDVLTRTPTTTTGQSDLADPAIPAVPLLITLGTPHTGSPWAALQPLAEIREHLQRWIESEDQDPARIFAAWQGGLAGPAREDLLPNSPYLNELNGRPWPASTRLVAVVAIIAAFNPDQPPTTPQERATLTARLGDGVVPVDSAATALAAETLFVRANHRSMIRAVELDAWARNQLGLTPPPTPPAIPLILDRLTKSSPASVLP